MTTEQELRELLCQTAARYTNDVRQAVNELMSLIKFTCYLKGERELPENPHRYIPPYKIDIAYEDDYPTVLAEGCSHRGFQEALALMLQPDSEGVSWKPCQEWEAKDEYGN